MKKHKEDALAQKLILKKGRKQSEILLNSCNKCWSEIF